MAVKIKNKTNSFIEIDDIGIRIESDEIYLLDDVEENSDDIVSLITNGSIVYVGVGDNELTQQESIDLNEDVINTTTDDATYSKDEIDEKLANLPSSSSIFGQNQILAESNSITTTTNIYDYTEKLNITPVITNTGVYRIGFTTDWNQDTNSDALYIQLLQGSTVISEKVIDNVDGGGSYMSTGSEFRKNLTFFEYVNLSAFNGYVFSIRFKGEKRNKKTSLFNSKLEFWRIS